MERIFVQIWIRILWLWFVCLGRYFELLASWIVGRCTFFLCAVLFVGLVHDRLVKIGDRYLKEPKSFVWFSD
jgi:hypothetical protein